MPQIMNIRNGCVLLICLGVASLLFGADVALKKSKKERLGSLRMLDVAPIDGFEFFSGHLDTSELPWDFLTVYLFTNIGDAPKLRIIGHDVSVDFPVSQIDQALQVYRLLVLRKVTADQQERDRLSRELEKYRKSK